jgi:hypothetical protein
VADHFKSFRSGTSFHRLEMADFETIQSSNLLNVFVVSNCNCRCWRHYDLASLLLLAYMLVLAFLLLLASKFLLAPSCFWCPSVTDIPAIAGVTAVAGAMLLPTSLLLSLLLIEFLNLPATLL